MSPAPQWYALYRWYTTELQTQPLPGGGMGVGLSKNSTTEKGPQPLPGRLPAITQNISLEESRQELCFLVQGARGLSLWKSLFLNNDK